MYERTSLSNGLRILTGPMPQTRSVTIAIFIGAGSRYENEPEAGISHFIEHLFFKGTERRPTALDISKQIEGVGGVLNAGTDRELTVYWCKVARPHFGLALDILVDALMNSKFEPNEIEKERQVVIEELSMIRDDPREWVDVVIDEVLWPDQPLGRDVAGSKETVSSFTRESAISYMKSHYAPTNTVIAVAGNISHQEVVESISGHLANWSAPAPAPWFPARNGQTVPRLRVEFKDTEQAHLCLAVHGLSSLHPERFALDLLNVVLGEGMSSRLFQEIREERGLAYDVHSYVSHFLDAGAATVYAGVDPKRVEGTIEAVLKELSRLKSEDIPPEELTKAKEFSKGRLLLRMEDTRSVASWIGAQELLLDRILTVDEVVEKVDEVSAEDIRRVANELLVSEKLNLAVVGPFKTDGAFQKLLQL